MERKTYEGSNTMNEDKKVYVSWYDHDCDYISKYCDEYHSVGASVPLSVLRPYIKEER